MSACIMVEYESQYCWLWMINVWLTFTGSMRDYQSLIDAAFRQYDNIGYHFMSRNLGYNLLVWMAFTDSEIINGGRQQMSLTGDPRVVFNRKRRMAQVGNINGTCDVVPSVKYDTQSSVMTIAYDGEKFAASSACMSTVYFANATNNFSEEWASVAGDYNLEVDMSSMVAAAAINQGILATYEIEMVPYTEYPMTINGSTYLTAMFFYPAFSNMDPLHCVYRSNTTVANSYGINREELFCSVQLAGRIFAIPAFNHIGKNFKAPVPCDCSEQQNTTEAWHCNQFQFITGFVFYSSVEELAEFALQSYHGRSGDELTRDAFNASFATLTKESEFNGASPWRSNAFEFCTLRNGISCSILSIFTGDIEGIFSVNGDYLQLPWGSCNNTIALSDSARAAIRNIPPNPLSEPYFECQKYARSTVYDEFSTAVGIVIPLRLFMIVCLAFILFAMAKRDEKSYNTHTFKEKQSALDFLAHVLLLIRDKKLDPNKTYDLNTLSTIQHELNAVGDIPKFYEVEMAPSGVRQVSVSSSKTFRDSVTNPLRNSDSGSQQNSS